MQYPFGLRQFGLLLYLPLLFLLAGCQPDSELTRPNSAQPNKSATIAAAQASQPEPRVYGEPDEHFLEIAKSFPTFAGAYFDDGSLEIMTTDGILPPGLEPGVALPIGVDVAEWSFLDLAAWYGPFVDALAETDWVYTDIDERANRLVAGVRDPVMARSVLEDTDIPEGIYVIRSSPEVQLTATLQQSVRPIVGGLEVGYSVPGGHRRATLGFNVQHWNYGDAFVVNAHLTPTVGTNDFQSISQPAHGSTIGQEVYDHPLRTNSCPTTYCRYSDAALVNTSSPVADSLGYVAMTGSDYNININGHYRIVDENLDPIDGTDVVYVGRESGERTGNINRTCSNVNPDGTNPENLTFLCQMTSSAAGDKGDSGAPVFTPVGSDDVRLVGLAFARQEDSYPPFDHDQWFSPIAQIRPELDPNGSLSCDGLETTYDGECGSSGGTAGDGDDDEECGPHTVICS